MKFGILAPVLALLACRARGVAAQDAGSFEFPADDTDTAAWNHSDVVYSNPITTVPSSESSNTGSLNYTDENASLPDLDSSDVLFGNGIAAIDKRAGDFYLRIMPLGASISYGYASTDGNGYRKWLRDKLRSVGWKVNMVGSQEGGNMNDRQCEGYPGWRINQVADVGVPAAQKYGPNLILINVGTNDCLQNWSTNQAGERMDAMLNGLFSASPGVTIVLSTLLPNLEHADCVANVNSQFRALVAKYPQKRLVLADMAQFLTLSDIRSDTVHPTDAGYAKMASVWWDAIRWAENIIQAPGNQVDDGQDAQSATCKKVAGNAPPAEQIQRGSGFDDGNYVHSSLPHGTLLKVPIDANTQYHFAQLVNVGGADRGGETDEAIRVTLKSGGTTSYAYKINEGGNFMYDWVPFSSGFDCRTTHKFADLNNDGLDDIWCIGSAGTVTVALNQGGRPPTFRSIGQILNPGAGYTANRVLIGDVDGDGRADVCVTETNGNLRCWRNGGTEDTVKFWQGFTGPTGGDIAFTSQGQTDIAGLRLGDLNGDFRADLLYIYDKGAVDTMVNRRGYGTGIVPGWNSAGRTHGGVNIAGARANITFGRIFGSGRLDYIYKKTVGTNWEFQVWENLGKGGTKLKGDGVYYCDMTGDGSDDYVWVRSDGNQANFFGNIHNPPYWFVGTSQLFAIDRSRRSIHIADWDGDGRCDILSQRKSDGALEMWKNNYDSNTGLFNFAYQGIVTGPATCTQGWGVGIFDRGLRLADVDGDGRADFLCLEPDGRITGWLNKAAGMEDVGQVKFAQGWDRANLRFADVEGHGRVDLLWLDKYTGAVTVLQNMGRKPASGSSFTWNGRGILYSPIDRGENMHFANIGGLGRSDMIHVLPYSNRAWVYWNRCPGGTGGDDPTSNPNIPDYTGPHSGGGNEDGGDGNGGDGSDGHIGCVEGTGPGELQDLCEFICHYDYCPRPCVCTREGVVPAAPLENNFLAVPINAKGVEYIAPCQAGCLLGMCPSFCTHTIPGIFNQKQVDYQATATGTPTSVFRPAGCATPTSVPIENRFFCYGKDHCASFNRGDKVAHWNEVDADEAAFSFIAWWQLYVNIEGITVDQTWVNMATSILFRWYGNDNNDPNQKLLGNHASTLSLGCDAVGDSCQDGVGCGASNYAALEAVLNGFVNIHRFYYSMYKGLDSADGPLIQFCEDLAKDFVERDDDPLKIFKDAFGYFDIISQVTGLSIWGKLLGKGALKIFQTVEKAATLRETIGSGMDAYGYIVGEVDSDFQQEVESASKLKSAVTSMLEASRKSIKDLLTYYFGGHDEYGMSALVSTLKGGAWSMDYSIIFDEYAFHRIFEYMFGCQMILIAWRMNDETYPVILAEKNEDWVQPNSAGKYQNGMDLSVGIPSQDVLDDTRLAYKGYTFWFLNAPRAALTEGLDYIGPMEKLQGWDKLEDGTAFDITWKTLATSAADGWINNGQKTPYSSSSLSDAVDQMLEEANGFTADTMFIPAGYVNIPVCDYQLVARNVQHYKLIHTRDEPCDSYPCCNDVDPLN